MDILVFVLTGLLVAAGVGALGAVLIGLVEVVRAYQNPARRADIAHRSWKENLRHMLH